MGDFTKSQAKRWVQQELAKHTTGDSIRTRLTSEEAMIAKGDKYGLPNAYQAHKDLKAALDTRLAEMAA